MSTTTTEPTALAAPPLWLRALLGIVLVLGGVLVLGDVASATLLSAIFIGFVAIFVGAFEIVHAFWTKGWGGMISHVALGILYILFGVMVVNQPLSGALALAFVIGAVFLAAGVLRMLVAVRHWSDGGWLMLISGAFGIFAGFVIFAGWPASGLWVLGLLLGIDLISNGIAWLSYGWLAAARAV